MKSKRLKCVLPVITAFLFAVLALPVQLAAQEQAKLHHHYKFFDVATFGGPNFFANFTGYQNRLLNNSGTLVGGADTTETDPFCFNSPDCFVMHAFRWREGTLTDLGTLPGGANSQAFWVNERGIIVGMSQNGVVDPLLGIQALKAVVWVDGEVIDLGTLEGGYESVAQSINNRGQVIGISLNTVPDPVAILGTTQNRAFLWEAGKMQDLGTLGGPDAHGEFINDHGQVAGLSFTDSAVNPATGVPTTHTFLWENGKMTDLGTLGGSYSSPSGLNNRGLVVGASSLRGDVGCSGFVDSCEMHPFVWEKGVMLDLGTLGGSSGGAQAVNDSGEIVGAAFNQNDQALLAFVWNKGVMTNLGALRGDDCSIAKALNSRGQIVGTSFSCAVGVPSETAALWENDSVIDLNGFLPPDSDLHLTGDDMYINDRGDIAGTAIRPNGDIRVFLLIPCDENHPDIEGCDYNLVDGASAAAQVRPGGISQAPTTSLTKLSPAEMMTRFRFFGAGRNRRFGIPQTSQRTALSGEATISAPTAALSPTSLTFSTQAIGTTSSAKTVTLKNTGTTSLTITAITIAGTNAGDFAQTHTCGSSLAVGASCSISVSFKPIASGTRTAALNVTDSAAGSPQQVALNGLGTTMKLSPTSLNFGTVAIGSTSPVKTATLTNVGTISLNITGIAITGINAGDFAQTHTCGSSLAAGAICSISVTFKPTTSGARSATLSIADNAAGSPQQVQLGGVGTTAKLFPTSLNFGTVTIGTSSPAKTVTLTNVGTIAISITGIAITGINSGDFAQTHTCGSLLAAGATCSINITFKPTASGTRTAVLSVSDNAAGSPQTVSLGGNCPGGRCGQVGAQCGPSFLPPCCPGLVCVPASTRAFCER